MSQQVATFGKAAPARTPAGPHADVLALQRKAGNRAVSGALRDEGSVPAIVHEAITREGAQSLDLATRAAMESAFGEDLGQVQVHTNLQAATSAQSLNALAYTIGEHIVFAPGQYAPGTSTGKRLLAHELAHVVQQRAHGVALQRADAQGAGDLAQMPRALHTPRGYVMPVQITLSLARLPTGASTIVGSSNKVLVEPPGGLTAAERTALDRTLSNAVTDLQRSSIYSEVLKRGLERNQVQLLVHITREDLDNERLRRIQEPIIVDEIRHALHGAWIEGEFKQEPAPVHQVRFAQQRITAVHNGIGRLYRQEQQALRAAARRPLIFYTPDPGLKPETPTTYLATADRILRQKPLYDRDLRDAIKFIELAEAALRGQQEVLERHNARYAFADEVLTPIARQVASMLSRGIVNVDEELLNDLEAASDRGYGHQILVLVSRIANDIRRQLRIVSTLFGAPEIREAAIAYQTAHPDDPLVVAIAAALIKERRDMQKELANALLPLQELAILLGRDPETWEDHDTSVWERIGAFCAAVLKVVDIVGGVKRVRAALKPGPQAPPKAGAQASTRSQTAGAQPAEGTTGRATVAPEAPVGQSAPGPARLPLPNVRPAGTRPSKRARTRSQKEHPARGVRPRPQAGRPNKGARPGPQRDTGERRGRREAQRKAASAYATGPLIQEQVGPPTQGQVIRGPWQATPDTPVAMAGKTPVAGASQTTGAPAAPVGSASLTSAAKAGAKAESTLKAGAKAKPTTAPSTPKKAKGRKKGAPSYMSNKDVVKNDLQAFMKDLHSAIPETSKGRKTVSIGLIRDEDGDLQLVWTGNRNYGGKAVSKKARELGIVREQTIPYEEGRGHVGAPGDAEQILVKVAHERKWKILAVVPSRPFCDDCAKLLGDMKALLIPPP